MFWIGIGIGIVFGAALASLVAIIILIHEQDWADL